MGEFTKVSGGWISEKGRATKSTPLETGTKALLKTERLREKEHTIGPPVKSTKESGKMALKQATACGRALPARPTSENGKLPKPTGMGFTHGPMVIGMKVSGKCS